MGRQTPRGRIDAIMQIVLLTALGVGGATVFGALIGFIFRNFTYRFGNVVLSYAAGVMLAAAIWGLIIPSLEYGGEYAVIATIAGIITGCVCIDMANKFVPCLHSIVAPDVQGCHENANVHRVLLFVVAIAVHNLPEGIAAGVGFGTEDTSQAIFVAIGIALQNIPEGMVIIGPMLSAGISPKRTFICAMLTGVIEVVGTFIGYFAVSVASVILPFALAFAGGTMLYVIGDDMIPETHVHSQSRAVSYALILGFCTMIIPSVLL